MNQMIENRHERTLLMFTPAEFAALQNARVLIAGCGAVGGMAAEALARTGVGHLTLVDFDKYAPSNLNRQIFATEKSIGQMKTSAAKERLLSIAPEIQIKEKQILINAQTVESLFDEPVDFVIDAIDSLNPKTLLIETLCNKKIPFVSAMGAALKTDMTRVRVSSMKKTIQCPLAAFVRKRLRRRMVDLSFPVVWSDECVADKSHLGECANEGSTQKGRHKMGSLITITGLFGLMCAQEALLYITKNKQSFYHEHF